MKVKCEGGGDADGTCDKMSTAAMSYGLPFDAVLLLDESEGDKVSAVSFIGGDSGGGELWGLMKNLMSVSWKGVDRVLEPPQQYLSERGNKKKSSRIRLVMD